MTRPEPPQLVAADRTAITDVMTVDVVTVRADLSIERLAELFLDQGLSRVAVVDELGRPIGVVSKTDLVIDAHTRGDTEVSQRGVRERGQHVHEVSALVRDIMTPVAFTLPASASLGDAARRLLADNVHAAPVVAPDGHVIGHLSATDIMAWVAGATPAAWC